MKRYPKYKDSGVEWIGEIPKDWELERIKYLSSLVKEQVSVNDFKDKEVIHYSIPNVQEFGTGISESGADIDSSKLVLKGGEIIISKLNPRKSTIAIVGDHKEMIVASGEFVVIEALKIQREYLYYVFISKPYTDFLDSQTESVTRSHQRVNPAVIHNSLVAYPTKKEQHAIVSFLDDKTSQIDALISNSEKKIELLKEKRTALINHVVTKGLDPKVKMKDSGVEWIGEIPEGWTVLKLTWVTDFITCGLAATPQYVDEDIGIPFLSAQNVKPDKLILNKFNYISKDLHAQLTKYRKPQKGDLLVTRVGAGIGEAAVVDVDFEFSVYVSLTHIRTNSKCLNRFLMYFFSTDYAKKLSSVGTVEGGGQGNLNVKNVESYRIGFPSIKEQQEIVKYLDHHTSEIDKEVSLEQRRIELLKEYRQSLISEVVTGKINVLDYAS